MKRFLAAGGLCLLSICFAAAGGSVKKEDVPKYLKQLQSSKVAKDRATAATMLGKRGAVNVNDVKSALEPLKTSAQKDIDSSVRKAATSALGAIGADPEETVPVLTEVLKNDKVLEVKLAAVEALGEFGPSAKSALPAINEFRAKQKDNKMVAAAVKGAVQAIAGKKKG